MYALNSNDLLQQYQRFMDLSDEPLIMMAPIRGYDSMPLVSLENAVQPLVPFISEIQHMVFIVKQRCGKSPPDHLSVDQSGAIMLYTLEWNPTEASFYHQLNKSLRNEDRQALRPWFLYLKLFFTALSLLPDTPCTVYRGVKHDLKHGYKKGQNIVWWGFSSCTSEMDVLKNEAFMGPSGKRTLFTIECQTGKNIKGHSYFKKESEVLLLAAREFETKSIFPQNDGLCLIQLKEVEPKYPLLETSSTVSQIVQKFPSHQPNPSQASYQPVYKQPVQSSLNQPYHIPSQVSTKQDDPEPTYISTKRDRSCSDYVGIACCFVCCCPCACCYYCCLDD